MYPVTIDAVPSLGAVHDTDAWLLPAVAVTDVGGPASPRVTLFDTVAGPVPAELVAATWNAQVPLLSPVIVVDSVLPLTFTGVCAVEPRYGVTVYPLMLAPPVDAGAVHDTVACPVPAVALAVAGAPGGPTGVTADDVPGTLVPSALVAATWKV